MMRVFLLVLVLTVGGCKTQPDEDMRPWLAVVGAYTLMKPAKISDECLCRGTKKVRTGDGIALVDCGCEGECKCKP